MTRVSLFSSPLLLGFDELERHLDRATKSAGDGYPPYNIEHFAAEPNQGERFRITLAVAGFGLDELEITLEDNQLSIRGRQKDDPGKSYLHRGIAARQFQRAFVLAEGMKIEEAALENGLLAIDLLRPVPERIVRRIAIKGV